MWSAGSLAVGLIAPYALVVRYAGFPGALPPVWLGLLDPVVHALAAAALLLWFCRREHLDAWHLGLDRARIDSAAGWTLALMGTALVAGASLAADPRWMDLAPELFAPARSLMLAAEYRPGGTTRALAALFALARAGPLGASEEIILTGLLHPTLRRTWGVLPCALACALTGAALHARPTECGFDPCLWPAAQAAAAHAIVSMGGALAYEGLRTLWIPILLRAGFALIRTAPGLPAALLS